ncbi:MAG: glycosyltransferase, partial [Rhodocyclaceae bacterium]
MRILMISDVYFPRINGVSTSIESFRHALAKLGCEVRLVAPAYPAPHDDDGCITRIPALKVPFDPEDRLMQPRRLRRTLFAHTHYDLVHIQTPFAAHYVGLRHARQHGLPAIATYHTHFEEYLHNYVPALPKAMLRTAARNIARLQCNALDAVVVPSGAMEETLRSYGVRAPLFRVPTGITVEHFAADEGCRLASAEFRRRFAIPLATPIALYVGRAAHEKNIGFLLDALPHALGRVPDLVLVIAGEGPALPALKHQAAALGLTAHVRFVGYLDRQS